MSNKKPDLKTASLIVLTIIILLAASSAIEYAKSGWDQCLADVGSENVATVKGLVLLFFLIITVFTTILQVITIKHSPGEDVLKDSCLIWLMANAFHILVVFCTLTGFLSYWLINILLVPIALFQCFVVFVMTMGSQFVKLMEGHGRLYLGIVLTIIVYHLFFAGILVARVVYHFSG